ncbi:bile acid:sodium symporter family protein [Acinetobacter portensis]|uniref:Bile acid:sodium symporter family protein n=2 Tax=Acinetobacter TaxID=469 RepID=A0AB35V0B7_9GAMM|nr:MULTISPECIES: bile acid:sodium symporter family protein [Acinetobacter]MBP7783430.1 bile acid:sodium symporter family protein [Acinetobacter sp.]MCK7610166.1 bile acid:sodium symporter family protein [Acinetobacter portensis]MCK7640944.1 bile acid:sodium symporter family protein [Acinetobacter portensis]MDY6461950.1 bile acid:sodium symporter family protein [Acinetobacter faecalis]MDY6486831.1 bile acid:sodium symporter family protein [Acinetobacter faecalis]
MSILFKFTQFVQKTFALWVILFSGLALYSPENFVWLKTYITWMLGIIMFGMGMTMTLGDFKSVLQSPKAVTIGVFAQFIVMPALAYLLCKLFNLPTEIAIGVILVGCCPGGTASNVITYMAKGNTALSVACTSVSTILAPILTPAIFYVLASQWIDINAMSMLKSILQVVLFPIVLGLLVRAILKNKVDHYIQVMPLISVVAIVAIVAAIIAGSKAQILESGLMILGVVILHNGLGLLLGFWAARIFKLPYTDCKAISIEVGMQNSGLGVALAAVHFALSPITAVPSAIFSLWHNISGSALATYWAAKSDKIEK